jgi:glycosidase
LADCLIAGLAEGRQLGIPSYLLRLMPFEKLHWVGHTNVYEVNLRQYTSAGTFEAFREHMPRLADMGVHTLWFMPLTPISTSQRKGSLGSYYACADYTSVNPEFGSLEEFRDLVGYAHRLGMKVIIDWVANHTGADHSWTISSPEYFIRNSEGVFYDKHGWDDVIDLDYSNTAMRLEMIRCMEFWIRECDIDGFRCDMAMLVPVDFWFQARTALDSVKKLFWLAECDQWNNPEYLDVFDAAYTWTWMHATKDFRWGNAPIGKLYEVLRGYQDLLPHDSIKAWFTSNHDENSWNGTEYEKYGEMAMPLAVFSCTWDGIPLLYSGQELPNLKRLAFFDKDEIAWGTEVKLHDFYKTLLSLKRDHAALAAASPLANTHLIHTDHADKVMCYARKAGHEEIIVMLNFSEWPLDVQIFDHLSLEGYVNLSQITTLRNSHPYMVSLPSWGYGVWVRK